MDEALFVVDSVKRMSDPLKKAVLRLKATKISNRIRRLNKQLAKEEYTDDGLEDIRAGLMTEEEEMIEQQIPAVLVMNKVDLVTSKRRLRELQNELEDIGEFDHIFYVSSNTGYGMAELREYLVSRA